MSARLTILNGPNLNLLGVREPHIYGTTTLDAISASCEDYAELARIMLVELIHRARQSADAIIINPAGYSFTSVAIFDALKAF